MNLTTEQMSQLKMQHKHERNGKVRDRIKALLLINDGYSYEQVAKILLVDDSTIRRHVDEYVESQKLSNNNKGSESKLNHRQKSELVEYLKASTFVNVKPIIDYIENKYNIKYTNSGLTTWLKQHGFTYKKPHPVPAKYHESKQQDFIKLLHDLKDENNPLYFLDAVHPEHQSKLAYGWIYKICNKAILTTSTQKRVHIFGALSYPTKELTITEADAINSQAVIAILEKIKFQHKPGQIINFILDNAKYQKSIIIKDYVAHNLNIKLHYLPAYSPNLNLIERVWKFMHKHVTNNHYYEHFENFKYHVLSFLRNIQNYKSELESLISFKFQKLNYNVANFVN
jgi:transposase